MTREVIRMIRSDTEKPPKLVYANWLASYRRGQEGRALGNADYSWLMSRRIDALLGAPGGRVYFLGNRDSPHWVTSWIACHIEPGRVTVHYVYTKGGELWRRKGNASTLLGAVLLDAGDDAEVRTTCTAVSRRAREWAERLGAAYVRPAAFLARVSPPVVKTVEIYTRRAAT